MANRFAEAAEEMRENLSRRMGLVIVCVAEVVSERDREIGVGLKAGQDQGTIVVQDTKGLPYTA
jgi:hypothetical protein